MHERKEVGLLTMVDACRTGGAGLIGPPTAAAAEDS
jgi:hypothetical protein